MPRVSAKTLAILLLLTTLFKGIIWSAAIPIWHAPDEQAHFAQVQYYVETKTNFKSGEPDLSQEIYLSERLLGTARDERGINKFTYNPNFRIEYSQTFDGVHEGQIKSLPKSSRSVFVKMEAARYPPLFYIVSSIGYSAAYPFDLFTRVVFTRLVSVLMAVATVFIAFRLGLSVFPTKPFFALSVAALTSFQPMFTFVSSGVNNDNLMNLLATALLWLMVDAIRYSTTARHAVGMGAVLGMGIVTKQLIYPFIPLPLIVMVIDALRHKRTLKEIVEKALPFFVVALLLGGVVFVREWQREGSLPSWPQIDQQKESAQLTVSLYLRDKLPLLYRETFPWYWGVFNWLGVVLPLQVLRSLKLALLLSAIGLLRYVWKKLRTRKITVHDWQLSFLLFASFWYAGWLLFWDFSLIRSIGFSHGIQGRNFFPALVAHLAIIGFGYANLSISRSGDVLKTGVAGMILLNFIALKTLLESYYDLWPLTTLLREASQYKPVFFKGVALLLWFALYLSVLANFCQRYFSFREEPGKDKGSDKT